MFETEAIDEFQIVKVRDQWREAVSSTAPADRKQAEKGIELAYQSAGLKPPEKIVWCDGPLSLLLTRIMFFEALKTSVSGFDPGPNVCSRISYFVYRAIESAEPTMTTPSSKALARVLSLFGFETSLRFDLNMHIWSALHDAMKQKGSTAQIDSVTGAAWTRLDGAIRERFAPYWSTGYCCPQCSDPRQKDYSPNIALGQQDGVCLGPFDCLASMNLIPKDQIEGPLMVAKNAGWWIPHKNVCWISERLSILRFDDRKRLHSDQGPAFRFRDGLEGWFWHGVRVPSWIIEEPEKILVRHIETENNAERRRVMVDRYGATRFLLDAGAQEIHRDTTGALYHKRLSKGEEFAMVKVRNSTPEPDGTFKDYFLQVPGGLRTAREAVAWTFGLTGAQYKPIVET